MSDVEMLAAWLTEECMVDHGWRCAHPDRYGPCDCAERDARELLASDWLAEYVATARAEERERIAAVIREQVAQWRETYPKAWPPFRGMDEQLIRRIARQAHVSCPPNDSSV